MYLGSIPILSGIDYKISSLKMFNQACKKRSSCIQYICMNMNNNATIITNRHFNNTTTNNNASIVNNTINIDADSSSDDSEDNSSDDGEELPLTVAFGLTPALAPPHLLKIQ